MIKFITGTVVGLFIGASAAAWAAGVYGSGDLVGWTVHMEGEEVCSDPSVDIPAKEINC